MDLFENDFGCVICLNHINSNHFQSKGMDFDVDNINIDSHSKVLLKLLHIDFDSGIKSYCFLNSNDDNNKDVKIVNTVIKIQSENTASTKALLSVDLSSTFPNVNDLPGHESDHNNINIYCQPCAERIKLFYNLLTEISRILHTLQELQLSVKRDFEKSLHQERNKDLANNFRMRDEDVDLLSHHNGLAYQKQLLRQRISKSLSWPPDPSNKIHQEPDSSASFCYSPKTLEKPNRDDCKAMAKLKENYDDPVDLVIDSVSLGGRTKQLNYKSEIINHSFVPDHFFSQDFIRLKKLYGLKECSIVVEKVKSVKKASLRNYHQLKSSRKREVDLPNQNELIPLSHQSDGDGSLQSIASGDTECVISSSNDNDANSESEGEDDDDELPRVKRRKNAKSKAENIINNKRVKIKRTKKPPYKPLAIHCTQEGCTRKNGFNTETDLEMHIQQAHRGITHPFVCTYPDCDKTFKERKRLRLHVRSIHLGQFPHICQYCGKGFTITPNLKAHLVTHTKEATFKCKEPNCDRIFLSAHGLQYHRRSAHTGERPYRCDRCGKGFFSLNKLNDHIKCVHEKGSDRPFICHQCGKDFPIQKYLYMHIRNSHQNKVGAEQERLKQGELFDGDVLVKVKNIKSSKTDPPIVVPNHSTENPEDNHRNNHPPSVNPLMIANIKNDSDMSLQNLTFPISLSTNPPISVSSSVHSLQLQSVLSSATIFANANHTHLAGFSHIPPNFNNYL